MHRTGVDSAVLSTVEMGTLGYESASDILLIIKLLGVFVRFHRIVIRTR